MVVRLFSGYSIYLDDACLEVLSGWQQQPSDHGATIVLEWFSLFLEIATTSVS
jgi:hypothetical protein